MWIHFWVGRKRNSLNIFAVGLPIVVPLLQRLCHFVEAQKLYYPISSNPTRHLGRDAKPAVGKSVENSQTRADAFHLLHFHHLERLPPGAEQILPAATSKTVRLFTRRELKRLARAGTA